MRDSFSGLRPDLFSHFSWFKFRGDDQILPTDSSAVEIKLVKIPEWDAIGSIKLKENSSWTLTNGEKYLLTAEPTANPDLTRLAVHQAGVDLKRVSVANYRGMTGVSKMRCTEDGKKLVMVNGKELGICDLATGIKLAIHKLSKQLLSQQAKLFLPSGSSMAIVGGAQVLDLKSGEILATTDKRIETLWGDVALSKKQFYVFDQSKLGRKPASDDDSDNLLKSKQVQLRVELKKNGPVNNLSVLDRQWFEFALKEILARKFGWEVSSDSRRPTLKVTVRESDILSENSLAKLLNIKMELLPAPGRSAVWEHVFNGQGKPISELNNIEIRSRTKSLVAGFNSEEIHVPKFVSANSSNRDDKRGFVSLVPLSTAKSTTENVAFERESNAVDMRGWYTGIAGLPVEVLSHSWLELNSQLQFNVGGEVHFAKEGDDTVLLYRLGNGQAIRRNINSGVEKQVTVAKGSPNIWIRPNTNQFIYFQKQDLLIGSLVDGKEKKILLPKEYRNPRFCFSPSGRFLAFQLDTNDLRIFRFDDLLAATSLKDVSELRRFDPGEDVFAIRFSGNEMFLAAETQGQDKLDLIWSLKTSELVQLPDAEKGVYQITLDHTGSSLLGLKNDDLRQTRIFKCSLSEGHTGVSFGSDLHELHVSPIGERIAMRGRNFVGLAEMESLSSMLKFKMKNNKRIPPNPLHLKWSPDGRFLAASSKDGDVTVWKMKE